MEWYTFGLDRVFMFLFSVFPGLAIVLTVMFGKDAKGLRKYIEMSWSFFTTFYWMHVMTTYLLVLEWVVLFSLAITFMWWSSWAINSGLFLFILRMRTVLRCSGAFFRWVIYFMRSHSWKANWCYCIGYPGRVLSTENFEELSNAVISARKWRSKLSRSNQLVLLREINNKINS